MLDCFHMPFIARILFFFGMHFIAFSRLLLGFYVKVKDMFFHIKDTKDMFRTISKTKLRLTIQKKHACYLYYCVVSNYDLNLSLM